MLENASLEASRRKKGGKEIDRKIIIQQHNSFNKGTISGYCWWGLDGGVPRLISHS